MDISALKKKIVDGLISDEELSRMLNANHSHGSKKNGFLNTVIRGFKEGYTEPMIFKAFLEFLLILIVVVSLSILAYKGVLSPEMSAVIFAFVVGFLFGKIK